MDGPEAKRILWRCRRGMKELDLLLERFAREHYTHAPADRKRAFERLLDLPDPRLVELLLGPPPRGMADPQGSASLPREERELAELVALVAAPRRR